MNRFLGTLNTSNHHNFQRKGAEGNIKDILGTQSQKVLLEKKSQQASEADIMEN